MRSLRWVAMHLRKSIVSRRGLLGWAVRGLLGWAVLGLMALFRPAMRASVRARAKDTLGPEFSPSDLAITDRAWSAMLLADVTARRLGQKFLNTEHVLLGLLEEGTGLAMNVLVNLNVDRKRLREELETLAHAGPNTVAVEISPRTRLVKHGRFPLRWWLWQWIVGRLPRTRLVKHAIEHAITESRGLDHNYLGTEHLLLGLLCVSDGVAAELLCDHQVTRTLVREEIVRLLGG